MAGSNGLTEYDDVRRSVSRHLVHGRLADVRDDEIPFLAVEAQANLRLVRCLVSSARVAQDLLQPAEVVYALARGGLPTGAGALLFQTPAALRAALTAGVAEGIVSQDGVGEVESVLDRFRGLVADRVLARDPEERGASLRAALGPVPGGC